MKEAYLYKKLNDAKVQCKNCAHCCIIENNGRGFCGVRENKNGTLYVLNYGKIIARNVDPVEKKPLFHFLPGSFTYSIATVGCNFKCQNCQNWDISQSSKPNKEILGENITPGKVVNEAIKNNCQSIAYTYTEPTIFLEFALDTMKIAKEKGLKNIWVSNGFMSKESAKLIIPCLNANNIDIKSFSDEFYRENCGGKLEPVLETAKLMKKSGVWVEITTLLIPALNDDAENLKQIANFIKKNLGSETPWHITQFSGRVSWKLKNLPDTPITTLQKAWEIGKKAGLKYVYTGNVAGLPSEDTFCPKCKTTAIDRTGYFVTRYDKNGKCAECGKNLNLILK